MLQPTFVDFTLGFLKCKLPESFIFQLGCSRLPSSRGSYCGRRPPPWSSMQYKTNIIRYVALNYTPSSAYLPWNWNTNPEPINVTLNVLLLASFTFPLTVSFTQTIFGTTFSSSQHTIRKPFLLNCFFLFFRDLNFSRIFSLI